MTELERLDALAAKLREAIDRVDQLQSELRRVTTEREVFRGALLQAQQDLEGREIQIRTLAKEIERWQSRIVEHKQVNRSLNLANQQLFKELRWLEEEKHNWTLGRDDRTALRRVRAVVRERMNATLPACMSVQGDADSRTLRQVEALLFPPGKKP